MLLLVLLLLMAGGWWLLQSGERTSGPPDMTSEMAESDDIVSVVAETAIASPATAVRGVAAEPRIPELASDAGAGGDTKEQLTIVIPAELLKESLKQDDLMIVIRWGDTLWEIAERYTGDPWNYRRIAQENNIRNPNLIFPRQKLNIRSEE